MDGSRYNLPALFLGLSKAMARMTAFDDDDVVVHFTAYQMFSRSVVVVIY
jgi:hypothetical protein